GCLHPLTAFPPPGSAVPDLRGIHFAIDGVPAASRRAALLARLLGGRVLRVPARSRVAYHLAASLTANGLVALLDAGIELAVSRLGLSEPQARAALVPLARAAVEGVARRGARRALTGPAARGDVETIRKHLIVLRSAPADVARLYRLLALRTVRLALADGRVSASRAAGIRRLLSAGRRAPAHPARAD
ncbi:MAG TPA: DUF2520 domain-containing protein, partial [Candidatus Polarisedimenticolia bacterium]|nr:DUF2520 domain-containing protein [Candidatus Polarisedimenticolia bacterium]